MQLVYTICNHGASYARFYILSCYTEMTWTLRIMGDVNLFLPGLCKLIKHRWTHLTYNIFLAISLIVPRAGRCVISIGFLLFMQADSCAIWMLCKYFGCTILRREVISLHWWKFKPYWKFVFRLLTCQIM